MAQANDWRGSLRVMRPGPFRRYMLGESVSATGTWMQMMAQGYVMTLLTNSAFMLGAVGFASGLPMLVLSMAAGVAADRYDKRWILLASLAVQSALAVVVGVLLATNRLELWHMFAVAAALGVASAFEMPAAAAIVPELVEKHEIQDAIALDRSIFHGTRMLGPAAAGGLVALWGPAVAFYANAASFWALGAALFTLPPRPAGNEEEEASRQSGMAEGVAHVKQDRPTLAMIAMIMMITVFVFPLISVMMPLYATNTLGAGPGGLGVLMALSGAGSVVGSLLLLGVAPERRHMRLALASAGMVAAQVILALSHTLTVAALALGLLSLSMSTLFGLGNTIIQERAPGPLRGRVSAVAGLASFGLMPFAGLVSPAIADWLGMRTEILLGAAAFAVGTFIILAGPGRSIHLPVLEEPVEVA